jgi:hypothetical protein
MLYESLSISNLDSVHPSPKPISSGSLAHGGFSNIYSDIDVGLLLNCNEPPNQISELIAEAKSLDVEYGKKLSVFLGNPDCTWDACR